jgi:hypothetical protein
MAALAVAAPTPAEEPVDQQLIAQIKMQGFQRSQLMDTLGYLTDVHGPRLKASPSYLQTCEWIRERLEGWGIDQVTLEPAGFIAQAWSLQGFSVEMLEPRYLRILAEPLAWSPSTQGTVTGQPILVEVDGPEDFDQYRGKLRGAIVLNGKPRSEPVARFDAEARRFSEEELVKGEEAIDPGRKLLDSYGAQPYSEARKSGRERKAKRAAIARFFLDEGVAALLVPSIWDSGLLLSQDISMDAGGFDLSSSAYDHPSIELAVPSFVIAREHYGRIARLLEKSVPVSLAVELEVASHEPASYNVIAELPGTDPRLKNEVVMTGGHLDSWHPGTGAADNAAGCAVSMEAMRILEAIGARPRRTIRMALWDAEEGGLTGSLTYVRRHFGDPETMELLPEHALLSAYFNLDNGTGKIRGVYLQGNEAVRPIFERWLEPFNYLGARTLAIQNSGGTDHLSFDYLGLPGFQFIQDDIDYSTRTHHSNMDLYEGVLEDDLKQAAVIVASFLWHAAMRDEKLPRKPLPEPVMTAGEGDP